MGVNSDTSSSHDSAQHIMDSDDKENLISEPVEVLRIFQHESLHSLVMPADEAATDEADAMVASITADLFAVAQNYSHEHRLVGDYLRSKPIDDPAELCTAIRQLFQRILDSIKTPTTSITARAPVQKSLVDSSRFSQVDVVLVTPHDFDHAGPRVYPSDVAPGLGDVFSTDVFAPVRIVCTSDEDDIDLGIYESELNDQLRHVLVSQPNRMFVWGILVFGTRAHIYLLLPDYTLRSRAYSLVARVDGRPMPNTTARPSLVLSEVLDLGSLTEFVEFFVYLAMCDTSLLGYDTTMRYLAGVDCWEIKCQQDVWPHDSESTPPVSGLPIAFYARAPMLHNISRLYGRHTRCFQASTTVFGKCRFVIKDTWALAPESYEGDTYLHEAFALKQITESRPFRTAVGDRRYQQLICGGIVRQKQSSNHPAQAMLNAGIVGPRLYSFRERTLMAWRYQLVAPPQEPHVGSLKFKRYHQRIVTTPAAMPVEMLKSKKDFLSGAADALNIHQMMEEHCRLIHGSMLPSNMVFYRLPGGTMSGFPVDLALAVDMEAEKKPAAKGSR